MHAAHVIKVTNPKWPWHAEPLEKLHLVYAPTKDDALRIMNGQSADFETVEHIHSREVPEWEYQMIRDCAAAMTAFKQ